MLRTAVSRTAAAPLRSEETGSVSDKCKIVERLRSQPGPLDQLSESTAGASPLTVAVVTAAGFAGASGFGL